MCRNSLSLSHLKLKIIGKMKVTIIVQMLYIGKKVAMLLSMLSFSLMSLIVLNSLYATINRFVKIRIFPPKTASLFGVIPHSEILNKIADKAIPFTMTVTITSPSRSQFPILLSDIFEVSAIENRIIAITPIKSILKIKRKSLSL